MYHNFLLYNENEGVRNALTNSIYSCPKPSEGPEGFALAFNEYFKSRSYRVGTKPEVCNILKAWLVYFELIIFSSKMQMV